MMLTAVTVSVPAINVTIWLVRLLALIPLIGGFLLTRESKGNIYWEILSVVLIVLATVVPAAPTISGLGDIIVAFFNRLGVLALLLGFAFVRDGGMRMIVGLMLVVMSGLLVFFPGQ